LLLATGELMRVTLAQAAKPDEVEQLIDAPRPALPPGQPERDVLGHREVREEIALLGDVSDPPPLGRHEAVGRVDDLACDGDRPGVRAVKTRHHAQQCRLAAARLPEHRDYGPVRYLEVKSPQDRGIRVRV
jgi:hypothetical protein